VPNDLLFSDDSESVDKNKMPHWQQAALIVLVRNVTLMFDQCMTNPLPKYTCT
jgi:hypothetical protein